MRPSLRELSLHLDSAISWPEVSAVTTQLALVVNFLCNVGSCGKAHQNKYPSQSILLEYLLPAGWHALQTRHKLQNQQFSLQLDRRMTYIDLDKQNPNLRRLFSFYNEYM